MKIITVDMVRSWEPCYDPTEIVPEDWEGTALDVLNLPIPAEDKFWVVLREEVLPKATLREFSRWCALQVKDLWDMPDVVCEYLETGNEELRYAAWDAAADAWASAADAWASAAAWDAAWAAAADAWASSAAWASAAWAYARFAQIEKLKEMLAL